MAPGPTFSSAWTQFRPPPPEFTDKDVPDLTGKVYIVTGSITGVGKEVARVLYAKNAKVYVAARSEGKANRAIYDIKLSAPLSKGELVFHKLDLADLDGVNKSAQSFLDMEDRLHVLFHNAGVMVSPETPILRTKQGHELSLGVNCIATLLFTELLTPVLALFAADGVGVDLGNLDYATPKPATERYGISNCGAWALGVEYARQRKADGIVSVPINPGNLSTELARDQGMGLKIAAKLAGYPPVNGAYAELFAGLSPDITLEKSGNWVIPFGRFYPLRQDLNRAVKLERDGGTGGCQKFYERVEDQIKQYL